MATSRYIQVTDWALLEYEYESQSILNSDVKVFKIENEYTDSSQFINGDISLKRTNNVSSQSSVLTNVVGNRWTSTNLSVTNIFLDDPKINKVEVTTDLTSNIQYDRVKLHIISGFNLEGLDGLIAEVKFNDKQGKSLTAAAFTVLSGNPDWSLSTEPLFLGDRLYDKYLEFRIPSLNSIITEFDANPSNAGSFGYIFTEDNTGFLRDGLIQFTLHEINDTNVVNGVTNFITGNKYETSFLAADLFALLGATVQESESGDYFEYYMTFDNGFPGNYINNLNSVGGQWSIIHQVEVFEQVTTETVRTSNMTVLQEGNYEQPNIFRPIILNSNIAFSFTINYVMRFLNRADGQQIIRRSTITSYEPKKYGRDLTKITVQQGYRPISVFNKIVSGDNQASSLSLSQNAGSLFQPAVDILYIPTYFSNSQIALTTEGSDSQELDGNVWGQGEAILLINEFDNIIRFKIYEKDIETTEFIAYNLTTTNSYLLSFILDSGEKIYIQPKRNPSLDPTEGEVEFLIEHEDAVKILSQERKTFYLISRGSVGDNETAVYQGKYENFANRDQVIEKLRKLRSNTAEEKIKKLEKLQKELESKEKTVNDSITELERLEEENRRLKEEIEISRLGLSQGADPDDTGRENRNFIDSETQRIREIEEGSRLIETTAKDTRDLLSKLRNSLRRSGKDDKRLILRDIPGQDLNLGSSFKSINPKVIKPANPNTTLEGTVNRKITGK